MCKEHRQRNRNTDRNKTERTFSPKPPDKTRNARKMLEQVS